MPRLIQTTLEEISAKLKTASESPRLDAQVLLAHILGVTRTWVLSHGDSLIPREHISALDVAVERLTRGEPLPYVLGHWEFFGLDFSISPSVLIPRPETELLVERALARLAHRKRARVADVGTGSGCIGVSLAHHAPQASVIASDISRSALEIARHNAHRHKVGAQMHFVQADLLSPYDWRSSSFDLICANLPYIPTETLAPLKVLRWEPEIALWGGVDGLLYIRKLLEQGRELVSTDGMLLLEIESSLGEPGVAAACDAFPRANISLKNDLAGHPRLLEIALD